MDVPFDGRISTAAMLSRAEPMIAENWPPMTSVCGGAASNVEV
jgi:hypothetical protein